MNKKKSFYDGEYHGYAIRLEATRKGVEYEPVYMGNPEDVYNFLRCLEDQDKERFLSILLDAKFRVIGVDEVSVGNFDFTVVDPREIFKTALVCNAVGIILAHNHPSGDPTPSKEDIRITKELKEGAKLLGLDLLDHVIIGYEKYTSIINEI